MNNDLEEYRRKNFAIRIEPGKYYLPGEKDVLVTRNGHQWSGFSLLPDEMVKLRDALNKEINNDNGYNKPALVLNDGTLLGAISKALDALGLALCDVRTEKIVGPIEEASFAKKTFSVLTEHQEEIVPGDLVRSEWQRINHE